MEICDNCALAAGGLELLLISSCVDHHDPFMPIYGDHADVILTKHKRLIADVTSIQHAHTWAYYQEH